SADEALEAGLIDEIEGREKKRDDFDLSMFAHAGRENAPDPVTKPLAAKVEETAAPESPVVEPEKTEPAPFNWDFAAFKAALSEGVQCPVSVRGVLSRFRSTRGSARSLSTARRSAARR